MARKHVGRIIGLAMAGTMWLAGAVAAAAPKPATFDCVLDPALTLKLGSPVASIIETVEVHRGDVVKKGEVVARLESAVEAATIAVDRVKAESQAAIEAKQARLTLAKSEFERQTTLLHKQATSGKKYDQARADYEMAQQDLAQAKLNHHVAEMDLRRAQAILDERVIRSPIDGVVTERSLGPGEYVNQDAHIVTVAQIDPLHVDTFLPIRYYGLIKRGDVATVRPDDPVGGERKAVVSVVDQVFDAASGTFGVRLDLPNSDHAVPAGLRCRVAFGFPEIAEGATAPTAELRLPR